MDWIWLFLAILIFPISPSLALPRIFTEVSNPESNIGINIPTFDDFSPRRRRNGIAVSSLYQETDEYGSPTTLPPQIKPLPIAPTSALTAEGAHNRAPSSQPHSGHLPANPHQHPNLQKVGIHLNKYSQIARETATVMVIPDCDTHQTLTLTVVSTIQDVAPDSPSPEADIPVEDVDGNRMAPEPPGVLVLTATSTITDRLNFVPDAVTNIPRRAIHLGSEETLTDEASETNYLDIVIETTQTILMTQTVTITGRSAPMGTKLLQTASGMTESDNIPRNHTTSPKPMAPFPVANTKGTRLQRDVVLPTSPLPFELTLGPAVLTDVFPTKAAEDCTFAGRKKIRLGLSDQFTMQLVDIDTPLFTTNARLVNVTSSYSPLSAAGIEHTPIAHQEGATSYNIGTFQEGKSASPNIFTQEGNFFPWQAEIPRGQPGGILERIETYIGPIKTYTRPLWDGGHETLTICGRSTGYQTILPQADDSLGPLVTDFWVASTIENTGDLYQRQIFSPVVEGPDAPVVASTIFAPEPSMPPSTTAKNRGISTATSITCSGSTWVIILCLMVIFPLIFTVVATETLVRHIWFRNLPPEYGPWFSAWTSHKAYERMLWTGSVTLIVIFVGILVACFLRNGICADIKSCEEEMGMRG
ncbi:hypothetical protein ABW19_dt0200763 [Dactylella cylindrospora]|nr:hypothetical protein ABW19_dt0200763 [Dactylella cylindrospora]